MPKLLLSSELVRWCRKEQNWAVEGTPSPQGSRNQNQGGGRAQIASPGEKSCAEGRTLLSCGCLRWSPRHSCPRSVWRRGDTELRGSAAPQCPQVTFPNYSFMTTEAYTPTNTVCASQHRIPLCRAALSLRTDTLFLVQWIKSQVSSFSKPLKPVGELNENCSS